MKGYRPAFVCAATNPPKDWIKILNNSERRNCRSTQHMQRYGTIAMASSKSADATLLHEISHAGVFGWRINHCRTISALAVRRNSLLLERAWSLASTSDMNWQCSAVIAVTYQFNTVSKVDSRMWKCCKVSVPSRK